MQMQSTDVEILNEGPGRSCDANIEEKNSNEALERNSRLRFFSSLFLEDERINALKASQNISNCIMRILIKDHYSISEIENFVLHVEKK